MVKGCEREFPHPMSEESKERPDWSWVPYEHEELVEGVTDTVTAAPEGRPMPLQCGRLTDKKTLVLLCPRCLKENGRVW